MTPVHFNSGVIIKTVTFN